MTPLQGRIKDLPKNLVLDEKTMLSIARMIAYVMVGSTPRKNVPPEMSRAAIELDARLVDSWLMGEKENVCEKCGN